MIRYEIRGATHDDEDALARLAQLLNTVNLPDDRSHIRELLDLTERSFRGHVEDPWDRRYTFILHDTEASTAAGTSMILARLGSRDAPYIYFNVFSEEKYSQSLDRHFHHTVMQIAYSYDGPSEIGGLIVHPDYRRSPERLGLLISYVRFLYIAMHRDRFRDQLLAELLPPLEADGKSPLWEALGRRFTNMTYAEADLLSSKDKDFIKDLFPHGSIYATLLSDEAQRSIGEVGAQTKGVEKMLHRIGFRYNNRVDPFDGGPHFVAETDDITLVRETRRLRVGQELDRATKSRFLVGRDIEGPPFFKALCLGALVQGDEIRMPAEAVQRLDLAVGDSVWCLTVPR